MYLYHKVQTDDGHNISAPPSELSTQALEHAMLKIANHRDKQALATLSQFFANKIYTLAYRKVADEQVAKEVVQDTLFNIWQKAHMFDIDKGNVTTWVYTIARNLCFDLGRKKLTRPVLVQADVLYADTQAGKCHSDDIEQKLDDGKVSKLLECLPVNQRRVVELVYLKDMSHHDAAEHLCVPIGTLKSRLRLALEKLAANTDKEAFGYEQ